MATLNNNQEAAQAVAKGIRYLAEQIIKDSTKIYDGIVLAVTTGGANISLNGEIHNIKQYGGTTIPTVGKTVKVFVPQNNMNLAFFIAPIDGNSGNRGVNDNINSISTLQTATVNTVKKAYNSGAIASVNGQTDDVVIPPSGVETRDSVYTGDGYSIKSIVFDEIFDPDILFVEGAMIFPKNQWGVFGSISYSDVQLTHINPDPITMQPTKTQITWSASTASIARNVEGVIYHYKAIKF